VGSVKCEDTFLIGRDGCKPLTKCCCEMTKYVVKDNGR